MSNKPGHRGEHEGSRKTIARGMPGLLRCTCGDYARVLTSLIAREASGALGARHSLRPLFLGEGRNGEWEQGESGEEGAVRHGGEGISNQWLTFGGFGEDGRYPATTAKALVH